MSDIIIYVVVFLLILSVAGLESLGSGDRGDTAERADMLLELRFMDESKIVSTADSEYEKWRAK